VIVFNNPAGGEGLVLMGGDNPVLQGAPSVIGTAVTIPGFFVQRSTGLTLAGATPPVTALAAAVFDGWGFMRIFDTSDPANPVQLAEWHSPGTDDPVRATEGTFTIHNPEVRGNQVLTSWYNEGFFVIDISNPSNPRDIGQWAGEGAPAGAPRSTSGAWSRTAACSWPATATSGSTSSSSRPKSRSNVHHGAGPHPLDAAADLSNHSPPARHKRPVSYRA
jgi:hypothetical protein